MYHYVICVGEVQTDGGLGGMMDAGHRSLKEIPVGRGFAQLALSDCDIQTTLKVLVQFEPGLRMFRGRNLFAYTTDRVFQSTGIEILDSTDASKTGQLDSDEFQTNLHDRFKP